MMSKNEKFVTSIACLVMLGCGLAACDMADDKAAQNKITVEVGEVLPFGDNSTAWLKEAKREKFLADTSNKIVAELASTDKAKIQIKDEKEYLPVGKYDVNIDEFHGKRIEFSTSGTLLVEDTTGPKVKRKDETPIEIAAGTNLLEYDWTEMYLIKEYSDFKINVSCKTLTNKELQNVKKGEYDLQLQFVDNFSNKTEEKIKVKIVDKNKSQEKEVKNEVKPGTDKNPNKEGNVSKKEPSQNKQPNKQETGNVVKPQPENTQPAPQPQPQPEVQQPTPQPQPQPEPPACEVVPAGSYPDFGAAAAAAQAELDAILNSGQWEMGRYVVNTHLTNCGVWYYTYEVMPF